MSAKVLMYIRGLEEGGAEKQVERLACGLGRHGFEIAVVYSGQWGPVGDRLTAAGIPVSRVSNRDLAGFTSQVRNAAPDIFHSFTHQDSVDLAAASAASVPLILASRVNIREWDPRLEAKEWELQRNRLTHEITAVSEAVAAVCAYVEGVPREMITVLHNGVELPAGGSNRASLRAELGIADHVPVIGYVANYRPEKGHAVLLRSFRLVLDRRPDARLVCCGIHRPETQETLVALLDDLNLQSNAPLLGPRSDVDAVYSGLDLYVHPSLFEGFSNSLLEAMAHGLPVVASRVGGTPEAVEEGVTGLLVPKGDAAALASAVVEMLVDPARLNKFGEAGRARVEQYFTVERMVESYARFYTQAWGRASRNRSLVAASGLNYRSAHDR